MTRNDLERKLVDIPPGARDVEPPDDLLDRLKAEIPQDLPGRPDRIEEPPPSATWTQRWKIAAALVLLLGGGYLTARLLPETERHLVVAPEPTETQPPVVQQRVPDETSEEMLEMDADEETGQGGVSRDDVTRGSASQGMQPEGEPEPEIGEELVIVPTPSPQRSIPKPKAESDSAGEAPQWVGRAAPLQRRQRDAAPTPPPALRARPSTPPPPPPPARPAPAEPPADAVLDLPSSAPPARKLEERKLEEREMERRVTFRDEIRVESEAPEGLVTSAMVAGVPVNEEQARLALLNLPDLSDGDFIDVRADRFSTFGLEVDTGSYTLARRYLTEGRLPPPETVRVEEWMNAFDYGDPSPTTDTFAMVVQGAPSPFGGLDAAKRHVLRLGVKATDKVPTQSGPASLTFVVDVSGSMEGPERLGLVKESLGLLLGELRPEDSVALIVYGDRGEVVLPHTRDKNEIREALDALVSHGSTNAEEGLILGYQEAEKAFRPNGVNRVILCSDGVANVGATGPDAILERVHEYAERGIELTTLGFGMGTFNDHLMEQLSDKGDGRYAYVDGLAEARRLLVEELAGTLMTVAEDTRAQVEWNPAAVRGYRLIGYENRAIPDAEFRYDSTDAGEIGPGHAVTALYEVELIEPIVPGRPLAAWHIRYRDPATDRFVEQTRHLKPSDLSPTWSEAPPALQFAALTAAAARTAERGEVRRLQRVVEPLGEVIRAAYPVDDRRTELVELLGRVGTAGAGS